MGPSNIPGPACPLKKEHHKQKIPGPACPTKKAHHKHKQAPVPWGSTLTPADFAAAAHSIDPRIDPLLVRAFARVESGGRSGFGPAGLPIIAYEGHRFRDYTDEKYDKDYPLLSYPYVTKAGPEWQKNNKNQKTAWEALTAACALQEDAALQACSWGMFQVMGSNYDICGYRDVRAFVVAMKTSQRGQIDAFVAFCKQTAGMRSAMLGKNYAKMARHYNGNDFGDYGKRIEKFYKLYGGT